MELIAELQSLAKQLRNLTPTDPELADAVGDLRAVETTLADIRHRWERLAHELDPVQDHDRSRRIDDNRHVGTPTAVGQRWELVPNYVNVRSYRSAPILAAVMQQLDETGLRGSMSDALRILSEADVVRITWMWSNLEKFCKQHHITLTTQAGAVDDDGDVAGAMVGVVRVSKGVNRVPIKEET